MHHRRPPTSSRRPNDLDLDRADGRARPESGIDQYVLEDLGGSQVLVFLAVVRLREVVQGLNLLSVPATLPTPFRFLEGSRDSIVSSQPSIVDLSHMPR